MCERLTDQGGGVLLEDVAEHFDVPPYVAAVAILSLDLPHQPPEDGHAAWPRRLTCAGLQN